MSSPIILYCRGHRIHIAAVLIIVMLPVILSLGETIVWLPWLRSGEAVVNVAALAALVFGAVVLLLFRNQLSRLELRSPLRWRRVDLAILVTLWGLAWAVAPFGVPTRFSYVATLTMTILILAGRFLRNDTLILLFCGATIAQLTLWGMVEYTPVRHLFFLLDDIPSPARLAVSVACLPIAVAALPGFKR